jgi:lipoprotein-anchoring transpeptidase ErfK/SrfK
MRSRAKYRLPRSQRGQFSRLPWLLVLAGLVVLVWTWWHRGQPTTPAPRPKAPVSAPGTQAVVQPKPTPRKAQPQAPPSVVPIPLPRPIAKPSLELAAPGAFPRPVQNVFEAQLALADQGISSGSLDGAIGPQTRAALRAFQQKEHLAVTGELDAATKEQLLLSTPPYTDYTVSANDLARLQPLSRTWLGKSQQTALDFETILELVAEKGHAHPNLVRRLNPSIDWTNVAAGTTVQLPDVAYGDASSKAAFATISLGGKVLEAFDANTNLLAHFPCSIAQHVQKRPVGELHVAVIAPNPNYTFDPDIFPESDEGRQLQRKLVLPPGPNNPVGVAWIGLDKSGYGIHGTPSPEQVGRTESHGCFRLANWNAEFLVTLVWVGMPVYVEP